MGQWEMCPCNTVPVTREHLLQHSHLQDALQKTTWPEDLPMTDGETVQRSGSPWEDGSFCERSWRFHVSTVIKGADWCKDTQGGCTGVHATLSLVSIPRCHP